MNKQTLQKVVDVIHSINNLPETILDGDVGCDFISDIIYNLPLDWKGTEDEDLMETFYQECESQGINY